MAERKGYADIAAEYRQKIADGEMRPGDPMPTVNELAQAYGVARNTAARVFNLLKSEALIVTRAGAGTVVADPPVVISGADRLERLTRTGLRYGPGEDSTDHRTMRRSADDGDLCRALELEPSEEVVIRIRTYRQNGRPTSVGVSVYPPRVVAEVPELADQAQMERFFGDIYTERTGRSVVTGTRTAHARHASQDELHAFQIDVPDHMAVAVLVTNVTFHDEDGPLAHWEDVYAPGQKVPMNSK
ncbi:GntR family transcriptional regulator [Streptomyces sp. NPDC014940]|uniref:GntR family transcriptional regulator n=1 Tax=Streptomyces sp. NPDC014940 TaxID=3364932 RepID=UPI003700CB53